MRYRGGSLAGWLVAMWCVGCASGAPPLRFESEPTLKLRPTSVAAESPEANATGTGSTAGARPGVTAANATVEDKVISSCELDTSALTGSELQLKGKQCWYQLRGVAEGADYELMVSVKLAGNGAYVIWPNGAWNGGKVKAWGVSYDRSANALWFANLNREEHLPKLEQILDQEWHAWRFVRTGGRLWCWLDGRLLLTTKTPAQGGQMGLRTYGAELLVRGVQARVLSPSEVAALPTDETLGWRVAPQVPKPAMKAGKPERMIGKCNLDELGWGEQSYAASPRTKVPFKLVKYADATTIKGKVLHFAGVVPAELDGSAPPEVVVSVSLGDATPWTGNSVPPPEPALRYAYRLNEACEARLLGVVDYDADDSLRFDDNAMLRIRGRDDRFTVDEWRVEGDKLKLTGSKQMGREALDDPLPPCAEAESLASLGDFAGRRGSELLSADPCVMRRLRARLGKARQKFEESTSMGLGTLEGHGGYLVSGGCMVHNCGGRQGAFSVDTATGVVEAVVVELNAQEKVRSATWFTVDGKPRDALRAHFPQFGP